MPRSSAGPFPDSWHSSGENTATGARPTADMSGVLDSHDGIKILHLRQLPAWGHRRIGPAAGSGQPVFGMRNKPVSPAEPLKGGGGGGGGNGAALNAVRPRVNANWRGARLRRSRPCGLVPRTGPALGRITARSRRTFARGSRRRCGFFWSRYGGGPGYRPIACSPRAPRRSGDG